jgi:predicted mannosyl-3-phosphoglycerate phosphatase (HAD superfamily)
VLAHTSYLLGNRVRRPNRTCAILIRETGTIEGVIAYARDERTGEYVQVLETGPTEFVQGEPQAWSTGNFETREAAIKFASKAYRWLNKGVK